MNPTANELKDPFMRLFPHQVALVETFFNPTSKRVILLRGDVGLGKTAALVALASRLVRDKPKARVLLLAPGALRLHFVEMLREADTPTLSVDRYQFREMLDSASEKGLWPEGFVASLSREFVSRQDIQDALATAKWDLLIVDEAHQFRGTVAERVLRMVGQVSERVVLATLPDVQLPEVFPEDSVTVVQWQRDRVVDHEGALLDSMPRPVLREINFNLSPAESHLAEVVRDLCRTFDAGTTQQRFVARLLFRSLQSSPAALESALRRIAEIRNRVAHGMDPLEESSEEEPIGDPVGAYLDLATAEKVAEIADRALGEIEAAGSDSKLEAFTDLLRHLDARRTPSTRICVLTEYVSTLFYLAAEIESLGKNYQPYHGGMVSESRATALARYSAGGGILTATIAAMSRGVALREVTDLVLYDVPSNSATLQLVLGRFDRFGRRTHLNVYALVPSGGPEGVVPESIGLLSQVLGSP